MKRTRDQLCELREEIERQNRALLLLPELRESGERTVAILSNMIGPDLLAGRRCSVVRG